MLLPSLVVSISLLLLLAVISCAAQRDGDASFAKRYASPPKWDPRHQNYTNAFKPNDELLLEVQWWSEVGTKKEQPSVLWRHKKPLRYSAKIGQVLSEKITIPLARNLLDNTTKIFVAAMMCRYTDNTAQNGCGKEKLRLGEAIRQNDHLKDVRTSPLRYLLSESSTEMRKPAWWVWRPKLKLQVVYDEDEYPELPNLFRARKSYLPPSILNNLEVTEFEEIRGEAVTVTFEFSLVFMGKLEYYWLAHLMQVFGWYENIFKRGQDFEDVKQTLLGNSWQVLYLTSIVALFHMLFDILAFKNDISFWRKLKSMKGVSVRSLFIGVVCKVIVWLFLKDNDSSKLVLIPAAIAILIDLWKLSKALRFGRGGLEFQVEEQAGYVGSNTKQFDKQAMKLVLYLLLPTVLFYAGYSLVYNKHRGWYSWALESVTSVVYAGGFLLMLPQVFVNYKLRSVAAMPWRAFVYRALNTFIDDLFAFVIVMPTMHRLSCFRDDVVFIIYLYQRWSYPVDHSRQEDTGKDDDDDNGGGPNSGKGSTRPADGKKNR